MLRKPSHDEIMDAIYKILTTAGDSSTEDIASYAASEILDLMTKPKPKKIYIKD